MIFGFSRKTYLSDKKTWSRVFYKADFFLDYSEIGFDDAQDPGRIAVCLEWAAVEGFRSC